MRTVEVNYYKYNELDDKARERAYNWYLEHFEFDPFLDSEQEMLEEEGFKNAKIQFSGFYSQGDGASFTADIDKDMFLVGEYECLKDVDFTLKITSLNSNYCHERTKRLEAITYHCTNEEAELISKLEEELEELRLDLCYRIYRNLESDYEYQTSEAAIAETMEANGYEFDERGVAI